MLGYRKVLQRQCIYTIVLQRLEGRIRKWLSNTPCSFFFLKKLYQSNVSRQMLVQMHRHHRNTPSIYLYQHLKLFSFVKQYYHLELWIPPLTSSCSCSGMHHTQAFVVSFFKLLACSPPTSSWHPPIRYCSYVATVIKALTIICYCSYVRFGSPRMLTLLDRWSNVYEKSEREREYFLLSFLLEHKKFA